MAETPSSAATPPPPPPPPPTPPSLSDQSPPQQYWCYQCDKRVPIETLPDQPDVICFECKNGFVELISVNPHHALSMIADDDDDENQPAFGHEFLQVLRLIAQAAREDARGEHAPEDDEQEVENVEREDDAPENETHGDEAPPPPPDRDGDVDRDDYLRIELEGWNENNDEDDDDDDEDGDGSDEDEDIVAIDTIDTENEDTMRRRQRRDVIRLQLRDFATRALTRRNRVLDWAEILMGLEDHSIEFRFQVPGDSDGYIGNPGDYVDAAGYEALLQNLAESDNGSRRGAPPAAKSAIEGLKTVDVKGIAIGMMNESEVCAICKDKVFNNEKEIVKELPCGHMYHEECIVPWLGARNTCPICRYELPTDDPEYEEERKKRANTGDVLAKGTTATTSESSSSGDGV